MELPILTLIIDLVLFIVSVLPLRRAAKTLKMKVKFKRLLITILIAGTIISAIDAFITTIGSLVATVILMAVYKKSFNLKWSKALLLWALQIVFVIISRTILNFFMSLIA